MMMQHTEYISISYRFSNIGSNAYLIFESYDSFGLSTKIDDFAPIYKSTYIFIDDFTSIIFFPLAICLFKSRSIAKLRQRIW